MIRLSFSFNEIKALNDIFNWQKSECNHRVEEQINGRIINVLNWQTDFVEMSPQILCKMQITSAMSFLAMSFLLWVHMPWVFLPRVCCHEFFCHESQIFSSFFLYYKLSAMSCCHEFFLPREATVPILGSSTTPNENLVLTLTCKRFLGNKQIFFFSFRIYLYFINLIQKAMIASSDKCPINRTPSSSTLFTVASFINVYSSD